MKIAVALVLVLVLFPLSCLAQSPNASKDWSADVSVYGLAVGMSGNTTVHGIIPADVDIPSCKIWDSLEATGMGEAAVWYWRWGSMERFL